MSTKIKTVKELTEKGLGLRLCRLGEEQERIKFEIEKREGISTPLNVWTSLKEKWDNVQQKVDEVRKELKIRQMAKNLTVNKSQYGSYCPYCTQRQEVPSNIDRRIEGQQYVIKCVDCGNILRITWKNGAYNVKTEILSDEDKPYFYSYIETRQYENENNN